MEKNIGRQQQMISQENFIEKTMRLLHTSSKKNFQKHIQVFRADSLLLLPSGRRERERERERVELVLWAAAVREGERERRKEERKKTHRKTMWRRRRNGTAEKEEEGGRGGLLSRRAVAVGRSGSRKMSGEDISKGLDNWSGVYFSTVVLYIGYLASTVEYFEFAGSRERVPAGKLREKLRGPSTRNIVRLCKYRQDMCTALLLFTDSSNILREMLQRGKRHLVFHSETFAWKNIQSFLSESARAWVNGAKEMYSKPMPKRCIKYGKHGAILFFF